MTSRERIPPRRRPPFGRVLVAVSALLCACGGSDPEPAARNLLLVTIDTLRADRLGTYGYERPTSPNLDALAEEGVVFERAYSVCSWTLPSVVSLLTSLHPSAHGCQADDSALPGEYVTLAERLSEADFATGAVTSHYYLSSKRQLDQGFDEFDQELVQNRGKSHEQISSPEVTDKGIAWLEGRASNGDDQRWFLWLHYFDPHSQYHDHAQGEGGVVPDFGESARDRYDEEIAFTDLHLGRLFDHLEAAGQLEDTLVVVIADHGEEFKEHGRGGHRATLYEEVLRVPLIFRGAGLTPGRVAAPVSCIDVAPTVYELLDVAPPRVFEGQSLGPLMRTPDLTTAARPRLLAEMRNRNKLDWDGLIEGRWKLLIDVTAERALLFDLATDPGEQDDVAADHPELVAQMRTRLEEARRDARLIAALFDAEQRLDLGPEDMARLEELGYAGNGGVSEGDREDVPAEDGGSR